MKQLYRVVLLLLCAYASAAPGVEPYDIRAFGSFQRMSHTGDTRGAVKLTDIAPRAGSYGVGALAGLRGEILLWDGKMLVTRGHAPSGGVEPAAPSDEAVLLVTARVDAWDETTVPEDMTQGQFEAFVLRTAKSKGLDAERAFPFTVRGALPRVSWHVVTGPAAKHGASGGSAPAPGHASNRVFDQAGVTGVLLGFHSGAGLEGVITHPGEGFHVHYSDPGFRFSGHVDEYRIAKGAVLALPRK